jgi:NAD(P)-dependent dehydrogenase (short-subunit alcohol dehydrogenase family)
MNLNLKDKSVLITGGSKGIGLSIAETFLGEGARVVITSRDSTNLTNALTHLIASGFKADHIQTIALDLSESSACTQLHQKFPDVDILVNNAGAIPGGNIFEIDEQKWRTSWELKVFGYINLTRLYLKNMQQRKQGVICNIIGMAGVAPRYEYICGAAANSALIAFTQGIGGASVRSGVRVFGINPSPTKSERMQTMLKKTATDKLGDPSRWMELTTTMPFGRMAEPYEIANLAALGCSELCGYLSGTVINVDGGQLFTTAQK